MKATGIVRRIDDLGRVVIPKEIRRTMRIREGDPLEIYTSNDGEVIFKKYSAINEMAGSAAQVAEVMTKLANCPTVVFDRDHVVATAGVQKKENVVLKLAFPESFRQYWKILLPKPGPHEYVPGSLPLQKEA